MLLRLDESNSNAIISAVKCICTFGVPNFLRKRNKCFFVTFKFIVLAPNMSFRNSFTPKFVSSHRMAAEFSHNNQKNFNRIFSEQHLMALSEHLNIESFQSSSSSFHFMEFDYEKIQKCLLFPNFIGNFSNFVKNLALDSNVPLNRKLKFLAYLTCVKVFVSENEQILEEELKCIFDLLLYIRTREFYNNNHNHINNNVSLQESDDTSTQIAALLQSKEFHNPLIKSIALLLTI